MKARPSRDIDHGMAHEETMQEDISGSEGDLRELEHDTDLQDEVDAFAAILALFFRGEAVEDGRRAEELVFREEPLGFGKEEKFAWKGGSLARRRHRSRIGGIVAQGRDRHSQARRVEVYGVSSRFEIS